MNVDHTYSQTETNVEKLRRYQEVIAEYNKLEDNYGNELYEERL